MVPIADQREARNAAIPILQLPTRPTSIPDSWWSDCSGASWVSSMGNGCCRLGAELVSVSSGVVPRPCRSHPNSAIGSMPVKRQSSSSVSAAGCDSAMVRTLQRLPTSDEAGSLVFAPPRPPLSSCHACRHVSPVQPHCFRSTPVRNGYRHPSESVRSVSGPRRLRM